MAALEIRGLMNFSFMDGSDSRYEGPICTIMIWLSALPSAQQTWGTLALINSPSPLPDQDLPPVHVAHEAPLPCCKEFHIVVPVQGGTGPGAGGKILNADRDGKTVDVVGGIGLAVSQEVAFLIAFGFVCHRGLLFLLSVFATPLLYRIML